MNQVMGSTVTNTIERNCWLVNSVPAAIMMDVVVLGIVLSRLKFDSVSA
jgi:hypothetical protein